LRVNRVRIGCQCAAVRLLVEWRADVLAYGARVVGCTCAAALTTENAGVDGCLSRRKVGGGEKWRSDERSEEEEEGRGGEKSHDRGANRSETLGRVCVWWRLAVRKGVYRGIA
jgi:hypothetical protein